MRLRTTLLPLLAVGALVLSACNGDDEVPTQDTEDVDTDATTEDDDAVEDEDATEDDDAVTDDDDAVEDDDATTDDEAAPAGPVEVTVATDDELGEHLVDGEGNTLYGTLAAEPCLDDCAQVWPPFVGEPEAGEGVDEELLDTIARDDTGETQVTYDGVALHWFLSDEPGDARGHSIGNQWFVVSPDGELIGADEFEDAAADDAENGEAENGEDEDGEDEDS